MLTPAWDHYFARKFARTDTFQLDLYQAASRFVKDRSCAVDAGAHVGSWSRVMARDFSEVHAFEPTGENFACLVENTRDMPVHRHFTALGASEGRCSMIRHGTNSGCWRVDDGVEVTVMTLDSLELSHVGLLKLDVEGYEGVVLHGAIRTLKACKPVVVFEDNGLGCLHYGDAWIDPKPILSRLGYRSRKRINKDEVWTCA